MLGTHDVEVTMIQCGDRMDIEPLGKGDHRSINGPERKIVVAAYQLGNSNPVAG